MNSYTSMKNKLEPLGLYALDGTGETDCELKAYAEGLDPVFGALDELEREYFIPTAQSFGISRRERFESREKPDLSISERREKLMYLERTITGDITERGFAEFLENIGLSNYTLNINYNTYTVNITVADSKSSGEKALIEKQVAAEIPAHMSLNIVFSE